MFERQASSAVGVEDPQTASLPAHLELSKIAAQDLRSLGVPALSRSTERVQIGLVYGLPPGPPSSEEVDAALADHMRIMLTMAPGAALSAAVEDAGSAAGRGSLTEADAISAAVAAQRLVSWAESRRMSMIDFVYQRRRLLGSRDLDLLANITDGQSLTEAYAELQDAADDLAGRSVVAEVAAAGTATEYSTAQRLDVALELNRLSGSWQALEAGLLDWPKVQAIADAVRPLTDRHALAVEARVLPGAQQTTVGQLRIALREAVIYVDPAGAEHRHQLATKTRGVSCRPADDGMGEVNCRLTAPEMLDFRHNLDILARDAKAENDTRTLNERRADVLVDLLDNAVTQPNSVVPVPNPMVPGPTSAAPGPTSAAPSPTSAAPSPSSSAEPSAPQPVKPHINVTVRLDTLLGENEAPADLHGYGPITAGVARDLAARGAWRCVVTGGRHGTILGMGRSTFTPHYRPPAATARMVRLRELTCVFPGCRRRADRCDLDHRRPHSRGGVTCECNLQPLCGHHHRLKHEAGFTVRLSDDPDDHPDTVVWTTPTGRQVRRQPPGTDTPPF